MFPSDSDGDSEIVNEARVRTLIQDFGNTFRSTVPVLFREFGQEKSQQFLDEIKFKIASQLFNLTALSDGHYQYKLKAGLDPRILIETSEYLDSFMYEELTHESGEIAFRVGVPRTMHSGGLPMKLLQRFLEYGTVRNGKVAMPPRPHWRPQIIAYQSRGPQMAREFRTMLAHRVADGMQSV